MDFTLKKEHTEDYYAFPEDSRHNGKDEGACGQGSPGLDQARLPTPVQPDQASRDGLQCVASSPGEREGELEHVSDSVRENVSSDPEKSGEGNYNQQHQCQTARFPSPLPDEYLLFHNRNVRPRDARNPLCSQQRNFYDDRVPFWWQH